MVALTVREFQPMGAYTAIIGMQLTVDNEPYIKNFKSLIQTINQKETLQHVDFRKMYYRKIFFSQRSGSFQSLPVVSGIVLTLSCRVFVHDYFSRKDRE